MRAFLFVGLIFSAFLIILGITSKNSTGGVLSNAVIVAGVLVLIFVSTVSVIAIVNGRNDRKS